MGSSNNTRNNTSTNVWKLASVGVFVLFVLNQVAANDYNIDAITEEASTDSNYCMLLLDSPITNRDFFSYLWQKAKVRGAVDGGCNRLYYDFISNQSDSSNLMPHFISGDFSSIHTNVKKFYNEKNIDIHETQDENETDMYKALKVLAERPDAIACKNVYVYNSALSSRVDHNAGNMNALFKAAKDDQLKNFNIFILTDANLMWVLSPGKSTIKIPSQISSQKLKCGILPFAGPSTVTTDGLKWNLDHQTLHFGDLISTSNTYEKSDVQVDTDQYVLFTMQLPAN